VGWVNQWQKLVVAKDEEKSRVFSAKHVQPQSKRQKRATPLWKSPILAELTSSSVNPFDLLLRSIMLSFF